MAFQLLVISVELATSYDNHSKYAWHAGAWTLVNLRCLSGVHMSYLRHKIRARICKPIQKPRNRQPYLSYRPARLAESIPRNRFLGSLKGLFGTDPDRNGVLEETPRSWTDSYRWLSHIGIRAPCATRRKRRYEANKVWLNTTFISQGSQSWGKLAVETWRVKTELIIITILHVTTTTTSILNLGFKTIAPRILAHTKMHK
jgi:hypothetical protein